MDVGGDRQGTEDRAGQEGGTALHVSKQQLCTLSKLSFSLSLRATGKATS